MKKLLLTVGLLGASFHFSGYAFAGGGQGVCGDSAFSGYAVEAVEFEECDDGNTKSGDGCNAQCKLEVPSNIDPKCYQKKWHDVCEAQFVQCDQDIDPAFKYDFCDSVFRGCLKEIQDQCQYPIAVDWVDVGVDIPKEPESPKEPDLPHQEPPAENPPAVLAPRPLEISGGGCSLNAAAPVSTWIGMLSGLAALHSPLAMRRVKKK